jgi:single-strand DNA-binding protein
MNKIVLIGNLTADPVLRATPSGTSVCNFTLAVNRRFPGADGQKVTDFFNIVTWRQQAENCAKYLAKGKKVAIVGELQARTYTAKDGTTRMSLDVQADEVEFLSPKEQPANSATVQNGTVKNDNPNTWPDISSDDLPFD